MTTIIFLLPCYKRESVSFIAYQYVTELRRQGVAAWIAALRSVELPDPDSMLKPLRRVLEADILVTNLFLPDLFGFLLTRVFRRIKWIPFLHCDVIGGLVAERKPFARMKARIWRSILRRAEVVISPSHYAMRSVPGIRASKLVPHCISPPVYERFRALASFDAELPPSTATVGREGSEGSYVFIGRDTPAKRLWSIFKLLAIDTNRGVKIIGPIDRSMRFFTRLTPKNQNRCYIFGFRKDPYDHIAPGDVVVCPSGREGFGLVPLECILRGIPVAVFDEGVFRELYCDTSIVYRSLSQIPVRIPALLGDYVALHSRYIGEQALAERAALLLSMFWLPFVVST